MKKFFSRFINATAVLCLWLCLPLSHSQAHFQDISTTHPNFHAIQFLQRQNIVQGYKVDADTRIFKSTQAVTRAEALKMLLLATKKPLNTNAKTYTDVPKKLWSYPYIETATKLGIVHGFQDGKFYPNTQVTKAEMLKMAFMTFNAPIHQTAADNDQAKWYEPFIQLAQKLKIITDTSTPQHPLSRGEVAEIIFRTHHTQQNNFTKPYIYSGSGKVSHYGGSFHGKSTANGEIYDKNALTAAHRTLPFNTRLKVWIGDQKDQYVIVRINDRGPYHKNRIIDLSEKAFSELAPLSQGVLEANFEVYTDPKETMIEVPEAVKKKLSTESQNMVVPEPVAEALEKDNTPAYITQKAPKSLEQGPKMFQESVPHLADTFFEDIRLRHPFPQKIRTGEVVIVSGQTRLDTHHRITFFLQSKSNPKAAPLEFTYPLTGRHFYLPIPMLKTGKYSFGMVLDDQKDAKMADLEVTPSDVKRTFPRSKKTFQTTLNINTKPENQAVVFSWHDTDRTVLHKLEFSSSKTKRVFRSVFLPGSLESITLPYSFFQEFSQTNDRLTVDLMAAESKDGTFANQQSNWEKAGFKNFLVAPYFQDTETKAISIQNFQRFLHQKTPIVLHGKRLGTTKFADKAYIKLPNQHLITQPIKFANDHTFSFAFHPTDWGMYQIQIIDQNGKTVFHRAIYVDPNNVLPVGHQKSFPLLNTNNLLTWTNQQRTTNLRSDKTLDKFAQQYAERLATENFLSHTAPNGLTFQARLKMAHLTQPTSENLTFGSTKELALQSLLDSPAHTSNMTNPQWSKVGLGMAKNKKGVYIVQVFQ
ncbi:hypothetical protein CSB37_00150 [bacterium DOLZORAL124_38_8]|nr:MAG: hypothetical protein CSB37_00150 [bacterium DOLZORAL124_38_8]